MKMMRTTVEGRIGEGRSSKRRKRSLISVDNAAESPMSQYVLWYSDALRVGVAAPASVGQAVCISFFFSTPTTPVHDNNKETKRGFTKPTHPVSVNRIQPRLLISNKIANT